MPDCPGAYACSRPDAVLHLVVLAHIHAPVVPRELVERKEDVWDARVTRVAVTTKKHNIISGHGTKNYVMPWTYCKHFLE